MPNEYSPNDTYEHSQPIPIDLLPITLGFIETEDVRQVRERLIAALTTSDKEELEVAKEEYHTLATAVIDQIADLEERRRAQLGMDIELGLIEIKADQPDEAIETLYDALEYATNIYEEDVAQSLRSVIEAMKSERLAISARIADTLRELGEDNGFDEQTCDELAKALPTLAIETAFNYVSQAGFDPFEVLGEFIEPLEEE